MKKWDKLPESMKLEEVKKYYQILKKKKISRFLMRFFDIIASLIPLILLSPLFLIIALLIKFNSKGPVFYRQIRVTRYNKNFRIFKFRTMYVNSDKVGSLVTVANDKRVTGVGNFLRKTKLDELPQLINVFLGQMSFVGTRPEVRRYVDMYSNSMMATLLMPAGITSSASIKYKDESSLIDSAKDIDKVYIEKILPDKMIFNLEDIEKYNVFRQILLIFKTVF